MSLHDAIFVFSNNQSAADAYRGNLVTNGTFESSSGWTFGGNWSFYEPSQYALCVNSSGNDQLSQAIDIIAGNTYQIEFRSQLSPGQTDAVTLFLGGTQSTEKYGTDTATNYSVEITAGSDNSNLVFQMDTSRTGFIDNVSIRFTGGLLSSDVLNMEDTDLEMGTGTPLYFNMKVREPFAGTGILTMYLKSWDSITQDTSDGNILAKQVSYSDLTAGKWIMRLAMPTNIDEGQYIYFLYSGSEQITAGSVDAWLDNGPSSSFNVQKTSSNI